MEESLLELLEWLGGAWRVFPHVSSLMDGFFDQNKATFESRKTTGNIKWMNSRVCRTWSNWLNDGLRIIGCSLNHLSAWSMIVFYTRCVLMMSCAN